ncbi:Heterotrimeric G-protein alpha subunit, GPA3-like protein [Mycena venus]|uniref:Heterotrimeric G-protein alpha subunit, GPA3-like protein n=1 Tax=Mycena venus TaxID=2733690 RepID=A0A8H7DDT8_9AGAR|nr:Heterotrimeric G-protein alpha subunit, GPA3-like protein [Mycena venus]
MCLAMCQCTSESKEAHASKARSDAIDRDITEARKRFRREANLLLLGAGESGKSTIVKQMKIIHQHGFEQRELVAYRPVIHKNVLDCAGTLARIIRRIGVAALPEDDRAHAVLLLRAFPRAAAVGEDENVDTLGGEGGSEIELGYDPAEVGVDPVPFTRTDNDEDRGGTSAAAQPLTLPAMDVHAVLTPELADAIWYIARVPAIERVMDEHPVEFYLMDNAGYFFSSVRRITAETYVPNEEDVLRARAKSTAIFETRFQMGDLSIHMFDVGGQRTERKKWIHCFESVTSIIFCTALSEYDQVLEEERRVNRMRESLYLFESVINSHWFHRTSVILFLNKIDVFKRKLSKIPLGRYFPEYAGGNDPQKAAKYILWKFMQENRAKLTIYPHVTQATNTKNIRLVFTAVKETILQNFISSLSTV